MKKQFFAVWACLALSFTLFSQNTDVVSDTVQMEEVVITHSKIPLTRKQTTKPIQVISRPQIEESAGKDITQILQEQAGIFISGAYSNPGKDKSIYLQGASNEYTLILVDGQPIVDPSGLGGSFDLRLFSLQSLERIEILPGSQSTLYGSDAIAGVINLITRGQSERAISTQGLVAYGSYNTLMANGGLNGSLGNINYNLNLTSLSTDGFSEARSKDPNIVFDEDGSKKLGANVNLSVAISENIHFKPHFRYSQFSGDFDDGAFADAPNKFESKVKQAGFQTQIESKKYYAMLHYGITKTDRSFQTTFGAYNYNGDFQNLDAVFSYRLSEKVRLIANANMQDWQILDSTGTLRNPSIQIASPSVQLLWQLNEKMNLETGVRFNHHSKFGSNSNASASWSYRPANKFLLFSAITSGFKAPALNQLYGQFGANEELKPQTSLHLEAGMSYTPENGKVSLALSGFTRKIKDVIAYDFNSGYINQNLQNDQGFSLKFEWEFSEKINLNGHYDYLTGKVEIPTSTGQDTSFNNLFRRPKHQFFLNLRFEPDKKLLLTLQGQRTGERQDLYFNPDNFFAEEAVTLEPYLMINAYADYRLLANRISVFLQLKNLLNAKFSEVYGFNTAGFNFTTGIRVKL